MRFRQLEPDDAEIVHALHSDPDTNLYNPYGASPDLATSGEMLDRWLDHAHTHGFGYELALIGDEPVGICGARHDRWQGVDVLNLYWRLQPEAQGQGLSGELATHALAVASTVVKPGQLIVARMLRDNVASTRVATRLGLTRRPDLDASVEGADWIVFATPAGPLAAEAPDQGASATAQRNRLRRR